MGGMFSGLHRDRAAAADRAALRERLALIIHTEVCKDTPCVPGQVDWSAVAETALAAADKQRWEAEA